MPIIQLRLIFLASMCFVSIRSEKKVRGPRSTALYDVSDYDFGWTPSYQLQAANLRSIPSPTESASPSFRQMFPSYIGSSVLYDTPNHGPNTALNARKYTDELLLDHTASTTGNYDFTELARQLPTISTFPLIVDNPQQYPGLTSMRKSFASVAPPLELANLPTSPVFTSPLNYLAARRYREIPAANKNVQLLVNSDQELQVLKTALSQGIPVTPQRWAFLRRNADVMFPTQSPVSNLVLPDGNLNWDVMGRYDKNTWPTLLQTVRGYSPAFDIEGNYVKYILTYYGYPTSYAANPNFVVKLLQEKGIPDNWEHISPLIMKIARKTLDERYA